MYKDLFPSFYMVEFDEEFYTYKNGLIETIKRLQQENVGVQKSNKGGWQSENFHPVYSPQFFKDEFGAKVVDFIKRTVNSKLNDMFICEITGLWININPPQSHNAEHTHPMSKLSGAFYVRVPEESGEFVFINNVERSRPLSPFLKDVAINDEVFIKPFDGQMLIFDSYMPHRVTENHSTEDRISIAFNIDVKINMEKISGS